jgi:lysozyme family protein
MVGDFKRALNIVLGNEGGWNDTPGDRGGETYCGIARTMHSDWCGWAKIDRWKQAHGIPSHGKLFAEWDIPGLAGDVEAFYRTFFWDKMHGDAVVDGAAACYFFDWYVNAGITATKKLQEVLGVTVDGAFGAGTLAAMNTMGPSLLRLLHTRRQRFYTDLVAAVPEYAKFLKGWLNRCGLLYDLLTDPH